MSCKSLYSSLCLHMLKHMYIFCTEPAQHEPLGITESQDSWDWKGSLETSSQAGILKTECPDTCPDIFWRSSRRLHNLSAKPMPVLSNLHSTEVLPGVQRKPLVLHFCTHCILSWHHWEEHISDLFAPSLHVFMDTDEILLNLLFTLWTIPAVSASPHRRGTLGPKNLRILLIFLAASTYFWLLFNLVSTRTQRSFSVFQLVVLSPVLLPRFVISKCRTSRFPLNFIWQLLVHLSRLTRSLWVAAQFSGMSATPLSFVSSKFAEGTDYSIVQIIKEIFEEDWTQC